MARTKRNGADVPATWPEDEPISSEPAEVATGERIPLYDDPRQVTVDVIRKRLEARLQPIDDTVDWRSVFVVTRRDLEEVLQDDLPPASIMSAAVRAPARVTVDAPCPQCLIAIEIALEIDRELRTHGNGSSEIKLTAKAKAVPHQHGQTRLRDVAAAVDGQEALPLEDVVEDVTAAGDQAAHLDGEEDQPIGPVCACGKAKVRAPDGRYACTNPDHPAGNAALAADDDPDEPLLPR